MSAAFDKRTLIALAILALVAGVAWATMAGDKLRLVTVVLLAFFAFRIVLVALRRSSEAKQADRFE
jgi:hypothetical protein